MRLRDLLSCGLLATLALSPQDGDARDANAFLTRGAPTFVVGTGGGDVAARGVRAQVDFIQGLLFPASEVVADSSFEAAKGPSAWPDHPVLYGGEHVNQALAVVGPELPFRVQEDRLEIAGRVYEGSEYRLIAVVPAGAPGERGPGHPNFLLYAGTGTPGVTEINAVPDYGFGFTVADRFGRLACGQFEEQEGRWRAVVTDRMRRLPWRDRTLELEGELGEVVLHRLELEPADGKDAAENAACLRGIALAARRLGVDSVGQIEVYIYPDRRSKQQLAGNGGDAHAEANSGTLHVLPFEASEGGAMERVLAHEATHVLGTRAHGVPGSGFWGEGLAVWASQFYGGLELGALKPKLPGGMRLVDFVGLPFHKAPESTGYPIAGQVVESLIEAHGLETFLREVYPLSPAESAAACERLGTSLDSLEARYKRP